MFFIAYQWLEDGLSRVLQSSGEGGGGDTIANLDPIVVEVEADMRRKKVLFFQVGRD